jgi:hypothetical protein
LRFEGLPLAAITPKSGEMSVADIGRGSAVLQNFAAPPMEA